MKIHLFALNVFFFSPGNKNFDLEQRGEKDLKKKGWRAESLAGIWEQLGVFVCVWFEHPSLREPIWVLDLGIEDILAGHHFQTDLQKSYVRFQTRFKLELESH